MESWMKVYIGFGLFVFEVMLEGGSFCFGDDVSFVDLCLMFQIYNVDCWDVDMLEMFKIQKVVCNFFGI